jgi:hypothetical protein
MRGCFVVLLAVTGCAPKTGWERTTSRVCDEATPATVCLEARPDRPVEARVGGETILPGECAVSPKGGGRVRVELRDEHRKRDKFGVRAPKAKRTTVTLDPKEKRRQVSRAACDQRP